MEVAAAILAAPIPDPPLLTSTAEPQAGRREGSCGRLLPGLVFRQREDCSVVCVLPFGREVLLPDGAWLDGDGFLFVPELPGGENK